MNSYKPARTNRAHIIIPLLLVFGGALSFTASALDTPLPALLQLIAVICFVVAVWVINRYSLTEFYYVLGENEPDVLTVRRLNGKKNAVVAAIPLSMTLAVVKNEKGALAAAGFAKPDSRVNFCTNMFPTESYYLILKAEDKTAAVLIEANGDFLGTIRLVAG